MERELLRMPGYCPSGPFRGGHYRRPGHVAPGPDGRAISHRAGWPRRREGLLRPVSSSTMPPGIGSWYR